MNLIQFGKTSKPVNDATLEAILIVLSEYGRPGILFLDTGWHAFCNMTTTVEGGNFEIRSEFGHTSPTNAAKECLDRVSKAVGGEA